MNCALQFIIEVKRYFSGENFTLRFSFKINQLNHNYTIYARTDKHL